MSINIYSFNLFKIFLMKFNVIWLVLNDSVIAYKWMEMIYNYSKSNIIDFFRFKILFTHKIIL